MTLVNQLFLHFSMDFSWFFIIFHVKMSEKFITKWWQPFFLHNWLNIFVIFSNVLATFTAFVGFWLYFSCLHSVLLFISSIFEEKKIPRDFDLMVGMGFLLFFLNLDLFSQFFDLFSQFRNLKKVSSPTEMVAIVKVHHLAATGNLKCIHCSFSCKVNSVILNWCWFSIKLVIRMGHRHPQVVAHQAHQIQAMRHIEAINQSRTTYRIR